jgi:hypothetical protein
VGVTSCGAAGVFPADLVVRGGEGEGRGKGTGEGRSRCGGGVAVLPSAEVAEEPGGGEGGGWVAAVAQR